MEPWWFLEPMFYTAFAILLIGGIIGLIVDKATDGQGFAAPIIVTISAIPLIITILHLYASYGKHHARLCDRLWIFRKEKPNDKRNCRKSSSNL